MNTLYELTQEQAAIVAELEENGGEMTAELAERLDLNASNLRDKVDGYNKVFQTEAAQVEAINAEIKRLTDLKRSKENAAKGLKEHLAAVMSINGIDKLEGNYCRVSFRNTKAVEVDEESLLYGWQGRFDEWRQALPSYLSLDIKVSKTALKEELNAGQEIQGAAIVENRSLQIR